MSVAGPLVRVGRFVFVGMDGAPGGVGRRKSPAGCRGRRPGWARMTGSWWFPMRRPGAVRFSPGRTPTPIGSRALREFIESEERVRLVVCGWRQGRAA